jgi:hypothetical protein
MLKKITKLLASNNHKRKIFAVREGSYKGNFIVCVNVSEDRYDFLMLPHNESISISRDDFDTGLKNKIVDVIEKLPHNVYEICCAQYNESKAKDNINRLKQPPAPSSVDCGEHKK